MSQSNLSIYIPRMSASITRDQVVTEFDKFGIGLVIRVDFTPINKKPGFFEIIGGDVKSAFVHLDYYYENKLTDTIVRKLDNGEIHRIYPACSIYRREYWILTNCNNPIQDTMMNTAQIVGNCRVLEDKIAEQADTIAKLEKSLDSVHQTVHQLIGGLFNHKTQSGMIDLHNDVLDGDYSNTDDNDTSRWNQYPTTRQGDECEDRVTKLESQIEMLNFYADPNVFDSIASVRYNNTSRMDIRELDVVVPQEEDYDGDECISLGDECISLSDECISLSDEYVNQYQSLKGSLFQDSDTDCDDSVVSTNSSMPDLIPCFESSDDDSEKRQRFTHDICGNE